VCRAWRSAAAGCSGIRLLYHTGYKPADQSFITWLGRNSHQLEALTLGSSNSDDYEPVLAALAEASAAAQAAGRPLRLHTLRVMQEYVAVGGEDFAVLRMQGYVGAQMAGRLLASLPHLRCLQLGMSWPPEGARTASGTSWVDLLQGPLAPLQAATQLQELYLQQPHPPDPSAGAGVARLLPLSLKRLSWEIHRSSLAHDLSHLTQVSFLRISGRPWENLSSSQLLPCLLQLGVMGIDPDHLEVLEEQQQVITALAASVLSREGVQQMVTRLPHLTTATVDAFDMYEPAAQAAVKQLTQLSSLTVTDIIMPGAARGLYGMQQAVATAASMSRLRRLHLQANTVRTICQLQPAVLAAVTQLTQLRVSMDIPSAGAEQQQAWAAAVPRMTGLQWLSLPCGLLGTNLGWSGSMQQLRVLVVCCAARLQGASLASTLPWLEGCTQQALPPRLQVLGVSGMTAQQAADWQLRRRLQQLVGSSGCEVVVGVNLDEAADPTQQLAGLPAALQQALV
jgi:hypothetical protein